MRPAEAMLEVLRSEGVERIFGNPGTTELPFMDALVDAPWLHYTLGLHEGPVVSMADGYARATGRPAAVNLHVAAGVANGLIGMLNAARSRTPLVITAGQQDRRHLLSDPMLSGDVVGIAAPVVKQAVEIHRAADLPLVLRRAFANARRAPAGPVLVSIPMDVLDETIELSVPEPTPTPQAGAADGIESAVELLAGARSPAIVAGDAVGRADVLTELVVLAEALGSPVYQQPMYDRVAFPQSHPLYGGMPLPTNASIRAALEGHDVVLIVGAHAFMAHHYTEGGPIPEGATVLQLDEDSAEIGRNFPVALGMVGALGPSLAALAAGLAGRVPAAATHAADAARRNAERRAEREHSERRQATPPLDPEVVATHIARALPADANVVEEAITVGLHLRRALRLDRAGAYAHTVGGGLGWGIGAAIGVRLGEPERPVVAVLGDGCALFGLQGLWTAARERVPVLFLVMNNGEYRTLKETLDRRAGASSVTGCYVGLDLRDPAVDWLAVGSAFGVPSRRIERLDELDQLVADAGRMDGPLLIDIPITRHEANRRKED